MRSALKLPQLLPLNIMLVDLSVPLNLTSWWSVGSMLGVMFSCQIFTGVLLSMHYANSASMAFESLVSMHYNVVGGWLLHYLHINGASVVFILLYTHLARSLVHRAYFSGVTWRIGLLLLIFSIGVAFMGYVLPWGQMSFWGATVITNLISAVPYVGTTLTEWVWGDFSVSAPTLARLYSLHFLLPFVLLLLIGLHLLALHQRGSSNPMGIRKVYSEISFHPYFTVKDLVGFRVLIGGLIFLACYSPEMLGDPDNYIQANPIVTPVHIQPEWYFLFAYAILRSVPSRLGGVIAIFFALISLALLVVSPKNISGLAFTRRYAHLSLSLLATRTGLTWLGIRAATFPFNSMSSVLALIYFLLIGLIVFNPLSKI